MCLFLALPFFVPLSAQEELLPVFHFNRLTTADGLPSNAILSNVVRDSKGFVWVGTGNGLSRYDGYGFKTYRNILNDSTSLSSSMIMMVKEDSKHRLWVGTYDAGLSLYDPVRDRFVNFHPRPGDSTWLQTGAVVTMFEDSSGVLWLGTVTGKAGIVRVELPMAAAASDIDSLVRGIRFRTYALGTPRNSANDLSMHSDGRILVASDSGLLFFDRRTGTVSRPDFPGSPGRQLNSVLMWRLIQDHSANLWLLTSEGLLKVNWKDGEVSGFRHSDEDTLSIARDNILDGVLERQGNIWLASTEGVDLFSPATGKRIPYLTFGATPGGSAAMLLSLDRMGTLWVSTGGAGLYWLSEKSRRFAHYSRGHTGTSPRGYETIERTRGGEYWICSYGTVSQLDVQTRSFVKSIDVLRGARGTYWDSNVHTSLLDAKGILWYCIWGPGLYKVDLAARQVKNYRYPDQIDKGDAAVRSIAPGTGDSLWIGATLDGLRKFDPASGRFVRGSRTRFDRANDVLKDRHGKIWVATLYAGLYRIDPAIDSVEHFVHDEADPRSLSNDRTNNLFEDPQGRIWFGAVSVINLWNPGSRTFSRYPNPAFRDASTARVIGSDRKGRLWVSYGDGQLSMFDPSSGQFVNFDVSDGVCGYVIDMENMEDGRVLLTGSGGLNLFDPDSVLQIRRATPPLAITRMSINDRPVVPASPVDGSGTLPLSYHQDVIELEFAALDIDAPRLVEYRYRLEGLENEWVEPKGRRFVRYPGLRPGEYVFRVRAASSRGEWPEQEIALAISIAPPWWQTRWAYAGYVLISIGFIAAGYRIRMKQLRQKQQAELEHLQVEHFAEVDRLKSRFFANISHDFRTPLTLILGPLQKWRERLASDDSEAGQAGIRSAGGTASGVAVNTGELQRDLSMAEKNARRLLRLINQLLDLSKLEAGAMKLHACRMNIVPLVKGIAYSFETSAGLRQIGLDVIVSREEIEVYCDREMVEKIIGNLVSNAFKFTPQGGRVVVDVRSITLSQSTPPDDWLVITVSDTGVGMPLEHLAKIFDRFYQVDESQTREHEGSGIGLALVKELVELHHGTIDVKSEVGRGTEFTIRLPLGRDHLKDREIAEAPSLHDPVSFEVPAAVTEKHVEEPKEEGRSVAAGDPRPIILVVEDNADVRAYVKSFLDAPYQVLEARDGAEGIKKAQEAVPDLVISDVMMPNTDGYELCKTLKLDERTSHIPVVLLTAKAGSENRMEGLETGADDYLVKPFEPNELLARVKNLIDLRRKLRERFSVGQVLKPGEIRVSSIDDAFLQKVKSIVEIHISEEGFGAEDLCNEIGMSRSQVHRKLTALTGMSSGDFMRYLRLHRAMDLLQQNAATVAEIAYSVGFGNPSHFSRRFHEHFGLAPSDVRKTPGWKPGSKGGPQKG